MSITSKLNQIKNAIYGREVRGAIHDAIKQVYDDASVNHDNANMEVKMARGAHNTLNDRLDKAEQKLDETNAQLSLGNSKFLGINIVDFPKLSGDVSDSERIQRAFDSVKSTYEGGSVYFPAGEYRLHTTVTGRNVSIVCDSRTIFKATQAMDFMFELNYDGELSFPHVSGGYQYRQFSIEKCSIHGDSLAGGIKTSGGHAVHFKNCMFHDNKGVGVEIVNGSKYYFHSCTFRGIVENSDVNQLAMKIGGSDHNLENVVVANYTKAFECNASHVYFHHCHHWLNHNNRLDDSVMYELNADKCVISDTYIDTIKKGIVINGNFKIMVSGLNGFNNPSFTLSDAQYIAVDSKYNPRIYISGATIDDITGSFFEGNLSTGKITATGVSGNCVKLFNVSDGDTVKYYSGFLNDTGKLTSTYSTSSTSVVDYMIDKTHEVVPCGKYLIKLPCVSTVRVYQYDSSGTFISRSFHQDVASIVLTLDENTKYLRFGVRSNERLDEFFNDVEVTKLSMTTRGTEIMLGSISENGNFVYYNDNYTIREFMEIDVDNLYSFEFNNTVKQIIIHEYDGGYGYRQRQLFADCGCVYKPNRNCKYIRITIESPQKDDIDSLVKLSSANAPHYVKGEISTDGSTQFNQSYVRTIFSNATPGGSYTATYNSGGVSIIKVAEFDAQKKLIKRAVFSGNSATFTCSPLTESFRFAIVCADPVDAFNNFNLTLNN